MKVLQKVRLYGLAPAFRSGVEKLRVSALRFNGASLPMKVQEQKAAAICRWGPVAPYTAAPPPLSALFFTKRTRRSTSRVSSA